MSKGYDEFISPGDLDDTESGESQDFGISKNGIGVGTV